VMDVSSHTHIDIKQNGSILRNKLYMWWWLLWQWKYWCRLFENV